MLYKFESQNANKENVDVGTVAQAGWGKSPSKTPPPFLGCPGGTTLTPTYTHFHTITPHFTPLHMNYNTLVFWSLLKGCADDTKKIEIVRDIWCSKNLPEPKIV